MELVILDPGLREIGGHHPGFASALSDLDTVNTGSTKATIYAHAKLGEFSTGKANIVRHFRTRFYKYFKNKPTLEEKSKYISDLAMEYVQVFDLYNTNTNSEVVFLYHTLCKEHAQALNLAIQLHGSTNPRLMHCVFLMFTPPLPSDALSYLDYSMSFKALNKNNNVQLFSSDKETLHANEMSINNTLHLHPCIFIENQKKVPKAHTNNNSIRILLFAGDAKSEKGFYDLPEIMKSLVNIPKSKNVEFVLQFTFGKYDKRIIKAKDEILSLAQKDARFLVHNSFWEESQIKAEFNKADAIVLNYDKKIYQNKSSGVLWMAASRNLTMLFLTDSWLNREAERLGCNSVLTSHAALPQVIQQDPGFKPESNKQLSAEQITYRSKVFQDFGIWIENLSATFNKTKPVTANN